VTRGYRKCRRRAGLGGHDALENPAQHVRRDTTAVSFAHCEVKPLEQPVECIAPDLVGDVGTIPPLQPVRLEEPAIQKRDGAEATRGPAPRRRRLIQRSEEEGAQEIAMDLPPPGQAPVHFLRQKARASAEPTLGLDVVEKEHPGELQKSESVSVVCVHGAGEPGGESIQRGAKLPEEPAANRLG
jgi:hypothetical protein